MKATRRKLLVSGAAVAAGAGHARSVSADPGPEDYDVEVDYPEEWLQRYRPAFVSDYHTMQRSVGLFAHRARADHYNYDIACYWHRLSHQDGLALLDSDGHEYDHEPAYVYVDDDGDVDRVVYTHYHHFSDVLDGEGLARALRSHETGDDTHVQLRIVDPWHHYAVDEGPEESDVTFLDVDGDGDASHLSTWESRGLFDSTASEAVYDPRSVEQRGSWWDESTWDYRVASTYYRVGQYIDIGGSEEAFD